MQSILQIIFGKVPLHLEACIASVRTYAEMNDIGYYLVMKPDNFFKIPKFDSALTRFLWMRHASDWIRTRILSETPYTLYIDWDIFLYPDFKIPDPEKMAFGKNSCIDAILYNGNQCNEFKAIHKRIEEPNCDDRYNLSKSLMVYATLNKIERFTGHYCHLDNCRFKDVLDYESRS